MNLIAKSLKCALAVMWLCGCSTDSSYSDVTVDPARAQALDPAIPPTGRDLTPRTKSANEWSVELGANVDECRRLVKWSEVSAKELLSRYPFDSKMRFLPPERTVVWTDGKERSNGWSRYLFGVFFDERKTRLIDLIEVRDGFKFPRVAGEYHKNLLRLRPGMSVEEMQTRIGVDDCQYYKDSSAKWRIKFSYVGFNGEMFAIEAEASTGVILIAANRSI